MRIAVNELDELMMVALLRRGLSQEHARFVVDGLVETSLRGVDSHGIAMFPAYLRELDEGRCPAKPRMSVERTRPGAATMDAGSALGLVAGAIAAREAVDLARVAGAGAITVRNSNHFGAGAVHALEMARRGSVGLCLSNSDALVVPHGGMNPLVGTNPISLAAMAEGGDIFCADFATSQGSFLKNLRAYDEGKPIASGVLVNARGEDVMRNGGRPIGLLPLGGHKGQCLGMIVEILCALLSGGAFDHEIDNMFVEPFDHARGISHFMLALDVSAFQDPRVFGTRLRGLLEFTRGLPARPGYRVGAPGDFEADTARERRGEGIPMDTALYQLLCNEGRNA